jgi:hypothetical protein
MTVLSRNIEIVWQFLQLFINFWPLYVALVVGIVVAGQMNSKPMVAAIKYLAITSTSMLFLVRLFVFIFYPYGEFTYRIENDEIKDVEMIVITHVGGTLQVYCNDSAAIQFVQKDLVGLKRPKITDYKIDKPGSVVIKRALMYEGISSISMVTKVEGNLTVNIPKSDTRDLTVITQTSQDTVDLSQCNFKNVRYVSSYSEGTAVLPDHDYPVNVELQGIQTMKYYPHTTFVAYDVCLARQKLWRHTLINTDGIAYAYTTEKNKEIKDFPLKVSLRYVMPNLVIKEVSSNNE